MPRLASPRTFDRFCPAGDRLLVEVDEAESQTASGVIIPERAQEKPLTGTVVAIGEDVGLDIEKGTTVLFGKYAGPMIEVEGWPYLILREEELLGYYA